jgi:hypothetical protein
VPRLGRRVRFGTQYAVIEVDYCRRRGILSHVLLFLRLHREAELLEAGSPSALVDGDGGALGAGEAELVVLTGLGAGRTAIVTCVADGLV